MSGSKIANICFLKSQEEKQIYWEEVFGFRPRKPLDAEALVRVNYGKTHEINGIQNMLHRLKDVNMWEIGFEQHEKHGLWFGSSPDGVIHWPQKFPNEPWGALEVKCSTKKKKQRNNSSQWCALLLHRSNARRNEVYASASQVQIHCVCVMVGKQVQNFIVKFDENF